MLVSNKDRKNAKQAYTRIEYDQTDTHLHHASDLDIQLPSDFDMAKYRDLTPEGKLKYANEKVSPALVVEYQNAIGKSLRSRSDLNPISIPEFAGKLPYPYETELTVEMNCKPNATKPHLLGMI